MRKILSICLFALISLSAFSQGAYRPKNLGTFDNKKYHFGFLLGFNSADSYVDLNPEYVIQDSLASINTSSQPGFNLGIVAAYHFTKNVTVRFIPSLSFQDRAFTYVFRSGVDSSQTFEKRIESTYIDFPVNFKFRTSRINNFAPYALVGAKYSIDMQSNKDVKNTLAEDIVVKIDDADFSYELGGGIDFFLQYFKFGIELKMAVGLPNLKVNDDTMFSRPIESLRTRTFMLTFTFEG